MKVYVELDFEEKRRGILGPSLKVTATSHRVVKGRIEGLSHSRLVSHEMPADALEALRAGLTWLAANYRWRTLQQPKWFDPHADPDIAAVLWEEAVAAQGMQEVDRVASVA